MTEDELKFITKSVSDFSTQIAAITLVFSTTMFIYRNPEILLSGLMESLEVYYTVKHKLFPIDYGFKLLENERVDKVRYIYRYKYKNKYFSFVSLNEASEEDIKNLIEAQELKEGVNRDTDTELSRPFFGASIVSGEKLKDVSDLVKEYYGPFYDFHSFLESGDIVVCNVLDELKFPKFEDLSYTLEILDRNFKTHTFGLGDTLKLDRSLKED